MNRDHILSILKDIENGNLSAELAAEKLRLEPYEEFSYANVDQSPGAPAGRAGGDLRRREDGGADLGHRGGDAAP